MKKLKELKNYPFSFLLKLTVYFAAIITAAVAVFIVVYILIKGIPSLKPSLFSIEFTSSNQSMLPSIINTFYITALTLLLAVPMGIFAAVYLAEYANQNNPVVRLIRLANETLAGIPSIVYGLFGFLAFVISKRDWGYSVASGVLTLAIMVLPLIIRTTEEALLAVDSTYREGSFGLGAGKLRTVFKIVLPSAVPGILAGVILAIGRIVGESAALIYTAGTVPDAAESLTSSASTLSVHLYRLINEGHYVDEAYATAVVLLLVVLAVNGLSSLVAGKIAKSTGEK